MIRAALVAVLLAAPAAAGTLEGRRVTFTVMAWEDPAQPFPAARGRTVTVGDGVEFGLEPETMAEGLTVVPAQVEIGPRRVEVTYPRGQGSFWQATFNGYVLRFDTECALFAGWAIDRGFTTLPIRDADIFTDRGALFINVAGMDYGPGARLAVDLDVTDCPLS